jgi:hypothetical protein
MNKPIVPDDIRALAANVNRTSMASLTRACLAAGLKGLNRVHWPAAEKILAGDQNADLILKAPTSPMGIGSSPILNRIAYAFLENLIPVSASAALIARSLRLQFDGAAQISIFGLTMPNAAFVAERAAIPVVQGTSALITVLTPYKLAVLITLTGEMMRNTNAENLVHDALLANVGISLDAAMFNNNAGVPNLSPPGLLNGVTPLTATAGGGLAAMAADIGALADALAPLSGNGQIVLIAAVKQATMLNMLLPNGPPYLVLASAAFPAGTVMAVATQALATVVSVPLVDASEDVTVQEQSTPSGDLMTSNPVRNVFQTDSVSLRFRLPCTWTMRGAGVAVINGTTW